MTPDELAAIDAASSRTRHYRNADTALLARIPVLVAEVRRCWARLWPHLPVMTMTGDHVYCEVCLNDNEEELRTGFCAGRMAREGRPSGGES